MTYKEIAKYFRLPNGARIQSLMEKYEIPRRNSAKRNQSREKNHMWSGGKILHKGYYLIKVREHPRADNRGYVPEHILVMEKHLGRYLKDYGFCNSKNEVAHHLNGNKKDNRIENLKLMTFGKHSGLHNKNKDYSNIKRDKNNGRFIKSNLNINVRRYKNE